MNMNYVFATLMILSVSCSQFSQTKGSPQSNNEVEAETQQLNNGDVVPTEAAPTPQNQNKTNKVKAISF